MTIKLQTYLLAMKERAPKLYAQLEKAGELQSTARRLVDEANAEIADVSMNLHIKRGGQKLPLMENAAHLNATRAEVQESVLANLLEFPPDETSPSSPAATTDSPATPT